MAGAQITLRRLYVRKAEYTNLHEVRPSQTYLYYYILLLNLCTNIKITNSNFLYDYNSNVFL